MIDSLIFGLCLAAFISLTSIVLVDLVGMNDLTSSFGLLNLVSEPKYASLSLVVKFQYQFTLFGKLLVN